MQITVTQLSVEHVEGCLRVVMVLDLDGKNTVQATSLKGEVTYALNGRKITVFKGAAGVAELPSEIASLDNLWAIRLVVAKALDAAMTAMADYAFDERKRLLDAINHS